MGDEHRPSSPPPTYEEAINDRPPPPYSENQNSFAVGSTHRQVSSHAATWADHSRVSPMTRSPNNVIVIQPGQWEKDNFHVNHRQVLWSQRSRARSAWDVTVYVRLYSVHHVRVIAKYFASIAWDSYHIYSFALPEFIYAGGAKKPAQKLSAIVAIGKLGSWRATTIEKIA